MVAELLDEGIEDVEAIAISWLTPLLPTGQVGNIRRSGTALPFILVNAIPGPEDVECANADDVVSIHTLCDKNNGDAAAILAARNAADNTHRRMMLLARYLEDVALPGGRIATIDYVDCPMRPRWEEFGDDQILRKVGRYRIGLSYARM